MVNYNVQREEQFKMKIPNFKTMVAGAIILASQAVTPQTAKAVENLLPQNTIMHATEMATDTLHWSKPLVLDSLSDKLSILDKVTGSDIAPQLERADSTLINKKGIDLSKVVKLAEKAYFETQDNLSTGLLTMLKNSKKAHIKDLFPGLKKSEYKELKSIFKERFNMTSDTVDLNPMQRAIIKAEIKENNSAYALNIMAEGNEGVDIYRGADKFVLSGKGAFLKEPAEEFVADSTDFEVIGKKLKTKFNNDELKALLANKDTVDAAIFIPRVQNYSYKEMRIVGVYPNTIMPLTPIQRSIAESILESRMPKGSKASNAISQAAATVVDTVKADSAKTANVVTPTISLVSDTVASKKVVAPDSVTTKIATPAASTIDAPISQKAGKTVKAKKGDTVWGIAKQTIQAQKGRKASNQETLAVTKQIMQEKNLTLESAKKLQIGTQIPISPKTLAMIATMPAVAVAVPAVYVGSKQKK